MSKITMPEPFGWLVDCLPKGGLAFQRQRPSEIQSLINSTVAVITTDKAKDYANARVKQALEEAAKIPRAYAEEIDNGLFGKRYPEQAAAIFNASTNMADRIRALITKEDE